MAIIRPFKGLRFSEAAGALRELVAPPYDVLSPPERDALASRSKHNIVHLTLPEQLPDDRNKFVKYGRSAARLEEWKRDGTFLREEKPALYRYRQRFVVPGADQPHTRTTLVSLLKVEPYENGVVLPHEQTFPKHKEDRLRILEATRSHLECILGLCEDEHLSVHRLVSESPATVVADLVSEDGIHQVFERIDDPDAVQAIVSGMADKKLWIADGHHRYETALHFRAQKGEQPGLIAEDFMMMAIGSMRDPGLVLLPTHRILKTMPMRGVDLRARLAERFDLVDGPNQSLKSLIEEYSRQGKRALGCALPGGRGFVFVVRDLAELSTRVRIEGSDRLRQLDVSILHGYVFQEVLGLSGLDFFGYTRDDAEAVDAVEAGAPASFLMNPPTVEDMQHIALGGERMPQKSTYYYPKLLSGLTLWSLEDFEP